MKNQKDEFIGWMRGRRFFAPIDYLVTQKSNGTNRKFESCSKVKKK